MRTSMNPPPPMFPASGSTTASANATATAASTAFPPRFMISTPASDASFSSLTTIPFGSRRALAGHSGSVSRAAVAVYSRGCVLFRDCACGCAATAVEERVKIANSAMSFVIEEDFRGLGRARQLRVCGRARHAHDEIGESEANAKSRILYRVEIRRSFVFMRLRGFLLEGCIE